MKKESSSQTLNLGGTGRESDRAYPGGRETIWEAIVLMKEGGPEHSAKKKVGKQRKG